MIRKISTITILVKDQDEALEFYTEKLGFQVRTDQTIGHGQRTLVVSPKDQTDVGIVLASADGQDKQDALGRQAGNGVLLVFNTNDCKKTFQELKGKGVEFLGQPKEQPWGMDVVFRDLYGNLFNLLQPKGWGG